MGKLDLITALTAVEEMLKRAPSRAAARSMATRLAGIRSHLLMEMASELAGNPKTAMAALVEAAQAIGFDNRQLAEAFNAAVERFPR